MRKAMRMDHEWIDFVGMTIGGVTFECRDFTRESCSAQPYNFVRSNSATIAIPKLSSTHRGAESPVASRLTHYLPGEIFVSQISTDIVLRPYVRLGANHGYVIDGDVAQLHADVEFLETPPLTGKWALQLWACEQPHAGGPLLGVKVAEAALSEPLDASDNAQRLDAAAQAQVPGGQRDYAMVLVLASGDNGHTQVHDFANYPVRQQFVTPHLDGRIDYRIDGEHVVLEADAIRSPRASDNLSGSLSLELWALAETYRGGTFEGHALGRAELGRLAGQTSLSAVVERVPFSPPPAGNWEIVLMLREWAGPTGYVTRDFTRFADRFIVPEPTPASATNAAVATPVTDTTIAAATPATDTNVVKATPGEDSAAVQAVPVSAERVARVSVNRATAKELAAVKGLSRKVADAIVKGRPYKSIDGLTAVRGIGEKLLDKLRANLTLD